MRADDFVENRLFFCGDKSILSDKKSKERMEEF